MGLLKNLAVGAIVAAGLTIATSSFSEESQKPVYFRSPFKNGKIESWYYGKKGFNGFKFNLSRHLRTCYFQDKIEETIAFFDTETGKWMEFSPYGTKKLIHNGIDEHKKYVSEQFMKCEETI